MASAVLRRGFTKIKAALQFNRVRELFHHEKIDLAEFNDTRMKLRAMISDVVDNPRGVSREKQEFIERVRAAVSEADKVNNISKVRRSFSKSITRQLNNIKTKLDALMIESCQFSPSGNSGHIRDLRVVRFLRVLCLKNIALQMLPDAFEQVPYLGYLDLSENEKLEILPASISRLHMLKFLRLSGCKNLIALPDLSLMKLEILKVDGCNKLEMSIVGRDYYKQVSNGDLGECKTLFSDGGIFLFQMGLLSATDMENFAAGTHVVEDTKLLASRTENTKLLDLDLINWLLGIKKKDRTENADGSSEQGNASRITMDGDQAMELPKWEPLVSNSFPGILKLTLTNIRGLQHLTPLRQLCNLQELHLQRMWNVECIEFDAPALASRFSVPDKSFPSLQKLVLDQMPNLKTWKQMEAGNGCLVDGDMMERIILKPFSYLCDLSIYQCPRLTYFPPCPRVTTLELGGVNEEMRFDAIRCLKKLIMYYNTKFFESEVINYVHDDTVDIDLKYFYIEKSLGIAHQAFKNCANSLRNLSIDGFYKLESLTGGGIEHLTNLQSLSIEDCPELDFIKLEQEEMPWKSLQSLCSLTFDRIPKMVNLPEGLQHLTSLQSLHIKRCNNLQAVGECLRDLTSLQLLHIEDCYNLKPLPEYINRRTPQLKLDIKKCPQLESV